MDTTLLNKYSGLKFRHPTTLFELDLTKIRETKRCPYLNCGNKLKAMRTRPMHMCTSKKHPKFVISSKKLL